MNTAARILTATRRRGVVPFESGDLRYASHEACHGIELGLDDWDVDTIHYALAEQRIGDRVVMECRARAVEQIVCARLGVATKTIEQWAYVTSMEALRNRLDVPIDAIVTGTRARMDCPKTLALAERILAVDF